jgi:NADH:ubiquinone oxidoreductase subunit K
MNNSSIEYHPRTTLVSLFGWVSLVGGLLMAALLTLNMFLLRYAMRVNGGELFPPEEMAQIPSGALVYLNHINTIWTVSIIAALLMAVAGWGVVRRRDWGRQLGIYMLAGSIILAFISIPASFMGSRGDVSAGGQIFVIILSVVQALASAALHGWLIWKLRTPAVRGEFVEPPSESLTR